MPNSVPLSLSAHLNTILPHDSLSSLRQSVIPTLLHAVSDIADCLRTTAHIGQIGSTNTSGDNQLNVDVETNNIIHSAIATCPSIVAASSEEDEGESQVTHSLSSGANSASSEKYAVAFDPLDGSSIIPANWTVGTIIGVWNGESALNQNPREKQIAAIMGVLGPRTTAIVALRVPESVTACFEVALSGKDSEFSVIRTKITLPPQAPPKATRYFAPANLRATAQSEAYRDLIAYYMKEAYTLRYSGGLVPDIVHALVKGHGVYISPVTPKYKAKLRRLYELTPIALIVECAGGKAVDPSDGSNILERPIAKVDETAGLICGTKEEVDLVVQKLVTGG